MDPDILLVIGLLLLSAFFSASETALMSVTPAKVRMLVEGKKRGATHLAKLKANHHKALITILVGNNFVNIAAASITTVIMTEYFDSAAIGIATGLLTVIILIFGEVIPKSLATTYAKQMSLMVAFPLRILEMVLTPVIWLFDQLVKIILLILGAEDERKVTEEELIAMASIGEEEGAIDEHERELIENVLEFNDIQVGEIMTPRIHMDAMPEDYTLDAAAEFVLNHTHSRIPIYRDTVDNVVGILSTKDLLKQLHEEEKTGEITLRQINLQQPLKVRESLMVHELFRRFKSKRTHMAIVLDEHGGVGGLITMEDLLEELVGDIEDEEDVEETIAELGKGHYELSGRTELDDLAELTGLEFTYPEYKTVSFLITEKLGRLPKTGQKVKIEGWEFKVTKMLRHTILKVELRKL